MYASTSSTGIVRMSPIQSECAPAKLLVSLPCDS